MLRTSSQRFVVSFNRDEGGSDESGFRFMNEGTMRWDVGNGREVVLVKARN